MKAAQDRQQKYANRRRRNLEFQPGEHVFLKVAPIKGIVRLGKRGKLNPRFIGPFQILERIGSQAYRLALPPALSQVHNVFHVSMLRKYVASPDHVLNFEHIPLSPNLSFEEEPVQILDRKTKKLRNKEIHLLKIPWKNHSPN